MKRELPHVRTNAYLDDRLVSADSGDPLPRTLEITKQVDDYFGAVLNSKKSSWTSTKLPSRRRRKLCELMDYTRSLVYLGVDVLMRGAPWCEPRVRMKQRVRAVVVRSELIRVLPPSQRGILVADAVASLWIAGGTSLGVRQLKPMSSKLAGALKGSVAKRYGKRARVAEHLFGPGVHRTFPLAAYIYTFCLQFRRVVSMGRLDVFRFANIWTHRAQCLGYVHGMVRSLPCNCCRLVCPVNSRQEVQRSISPLSKVITGCHLKLESSYMPRVKGQAGCRICDLFCASLSLVSWHWSARVIMARSLEERLMIRCGVMRCTVSCIASEARLCFVLVSGQRWHWLLHASAEHGICPRCKEAPENLMHRLWYCQTTVQYRL